MLTKKQPVWRKFFYSSLALVLTYPIVTIAALNEVNGTLRNKQLAQYHGKGFHGRKHGVMMHYAQQHPHYRAVSHGHQENMHRVKHHPNRKISTHHAVHHE